MPDDNDGPESLPDDPVADCVFGPGPGEAQYATDGSEQAATNTPTNARISLRPIVLSRFIDQSRRM